MRKSAEGMKIGVMEEWKREYMKVITIYYCLLLLRVSEERRLKWVYSTYGYMILV
jgi:hypothetical protein